MSDFEVMPIGTKARIEELESAIKEFLELDHGSYDSDPLRWEIESIQNKFKHLLKK